MTASPDCHSPPTTHPTAWLGGLVKNQWKVPLSGTPACSPAQALRLKPRLRLAVTIPWTFQKAHTLELIIGKSFQAQKAYRYFIYRTKWKAYQFHCGEQTLFTENSSSSPVAKHIIKVPFYLWTVAYILILRLKMIKPAFTGMVWINTNTICLFNMY